MNITPPRGRQLLPTQPEQRAYLKKIREAADRGDLQAMEALLNIVHLQHIDSGITQLLGQNSGWAGDANDPKEKILAAIRANDPASKQLTENQ